MTFEGLGRDSIDFDGQLLRLREVDSQGIDKSGKGQSFTLRTAGKVLNGFATKIDGGGRPIDGDPGGAIGEHEEREESSSGIFTEGEEKILQAGCFIRAGRSLEDDAGQAAAVGEGIKEADHAPGICRGRNRRRRGRDLDTDRWCCGGE